MAKSLIFLILVLLILSYYFDLQGVFFDWSTLKMTKCQITCKSLQKSSKCQRGLALSHFKD